MELSVGINAQTAQIDWFGEDYLMLKNDAWTRLVDYYNSL